MNTQVELQLIGLIPNILWAILLIVALVVFYKPLRYDVLPRMREFNAFGVEVTLIEQNFADTPGNGHSGTQTELSWRAYYADNTGRP